MKNDNTPLQYLGVMVSSTFIDLKEHRAALIKAINQLDLKAVVMENDAAKTIDVIESSLQMVQKASAYIGVISHKYGQVPPDELRNPDNLSLTELEFNEALKLSRPILLFIMGDNHPLTRADVETDPEKLQKLNAFRERAKEMGPGSPVHRVFAVFNDLPHFVDLANNSVGGLPEFLYQTSAQTAPIQVSSHLSQSVEGRLSERVAPGGDFDNWLTPSSKIFPAAVISFRERLRPDIRGGWLTDELDTEAFLSEANLASQGKLFAAGVLLFQEHPEHLIPSAYVQCVKYQGLTRAAAQVGVECKGPLLSQIESAMSFIVDHVEKIETTEAGSVSAKFEFQYPMNCLREVLANALCHRNYTDYKRHTHVRLFADRIEVVSPGSWGSMEIEADRDIRLLDLECEPASRNERLATALRRILIVETQGSGIPSAVDDCKEQGAEIPKVRNGDNTIKVTVFPRNDWKDGHTFGRRGTVAVSVRGGSHELIPIPPRLFAEPPYIGSHRFIGRKSELERLSDWAAAADPHPVLLFEAIGGTGKSMLTWEWTTKHATEVRGDWAGIFWYSFYEKGAMMADCCRRALAYMTGEPLEAFQKLNRLVLSERLLHQLRARPWLLILDGLERVLVAYHRIDAAQVGDEEAGKTDEIADRDPSGTIRPEDDDLLRALAGATPSKITISSRLIPRVFLNAASQAIPGVLRVPLAGLRPEDAEALLRSYGVTGTSPGIRDYLKSHCDCHPLVTGVLAGLINSYLPSRGNFDEWVDDPAGGGLLNLANLDLVQKRNHILHTAFAALPEESRQLLSTLALLSQSVDYETLQALNPHLPAEPEEVAEPRKPEDGWRWQMMSDYEKEDARQTYQTVLQRRKGYEEAMRVWWRSPEFLVAADELTKTVADLERRGLLQYEAQTKRYDLHPVVRGIAAGGLRQEEKVRYGQRVVDHFSQKAHGPYDEAETLDDLRVGIQVVRTLLQMGRYEQAFEGYSDVSRALQYNLEANAEALSLVRPFFPNGWGTLPEDMTARHGAWLANEGAMLLANTGESEEALVAYGAAIHSDLRNEDFASSCAILRNIAITLETQGGRLAKAHTLFRLAIEVATLLMDEALIFAGRLDLFAQSIELGQFQEAEALWRLLDPMGRDWPRSHYRPGGAEYWFARGRFLQGVLTEEHLIEAEQHARVGRNRFIIRGLHDLRGEWLLDRSEWALATDSLNEAVRMAREVGQTAPRAETMLAYAKLHLDQLRSPREEAERLAKTKNPAHRVLADLWFAIGDADQAKRHARAAYNEAWADGEPFVYRYELKKARALLEQLGAEIPDLPPYDPAKDERLPWEDEVVSAIEKLRAKKKAVADAEKAEANKKGGQAIKLPARSSKKSVKKTATKHDQKPGKKAAEKTGKRVRKRSKDE